MTTWPYTPAIAKIISVKNEWAWVSLVSYLEKEMKIKVLKRGKKSWEPLRICLLNSTANPAQFWCKVAQLAGKS